MTPDLSTTNLWLAILAIASAGQFLMLVAAALFGMRRITGAYVAARGVPIARSSVKSIVSPTTVSLP